MRSLKFQVEKTEKDYHDLRIANKSGPSQSELAAFMAAQTIAAQNAANEQIIVNMFS